MKKFLVIASALLISSCASIIEGSTQKINVATQPNTPATCTVKRSDAAYNTFFDAPGTVEVAKSKNPVEITCTPKDGSPAGTARVFSDISAWGYGGAALTLGVGAIVDGSTGAASKYPDNVTVVLGQNTNVGLGSMNSNADYNK